MAKDCVKLFVCGYAVGAAAILVRFNLTTHTGTPVLFIATYVKALTPNVHLNQP